MKIHVVGIGGTGMSAIARILVADGHEVSGSDGARWPLADALVPLGVRVHESFAADHVRGADVVLRSSAYGEDNVEVAAARAAGVAIWRRHEAWAELAKTRLVLAVAGTHGKTTTTAMAWHALRAGGVDASLICGATVAALGANAHAGLDAILVLEADEYDRTFLALAPQVAIVTNVDHDHTDQFPTREEYADAFRAFAARASVLICCADDPGARELSASYPGALTYGTTEGDVKILDLGERGTGVAFTLSTAEGSREVALRVPGEHNARNASAAILAAQRLGVPFEAAVHGVGEFGGTSRRLETLGTAAGVTVVDDYAHHPTEIEASIGAMRGRGGGRVVALFQPHTPSRLAAFRDGFVRSLRQADLRMVARTFPSARESDDGGASARDLAQRADAVYVDGIEEAARELAALARPGDLVLIMGAGDIRAAGERLLELLKVHA